MARQAISFFRHYFVDDGLPSNTVQAILQDKFRLYGVGTGIVYVVMMAHDKKILLQL